MIRATFEVGLGDMATGVPRRAITHPWVYRASRTHIIAIVVAFCLSVWALDLGLDLLWAKFGRVVAVPMAAADALLAMAFAAVVLKLMLLQRARHGKVIQRLKTVAEMNHHIRNALDEIQLTAYLTNNYQFVKDIEGATKRIQWALSDILPEEGDGAQGPKRAE